MNTSADLLTVLQAIHREKLTLRQRHVAVARQVGDYAFNNTYQYVINREDTHLQWLEAAIVELGATPADVGEPVLPPAGKHANFRRLVEEDAREAAELVARWRERIAGLGHARHRTMLGVMLGETLEHRRFFDQIVEGRDDVLGRRANGPGPSGTDGTVMADRWIGWRG